MRCIVHSLYTHPTLLPVVVAVAAVADVASCWRCYIPHISVQLLVVFSLISKCNSVSSARNPDLTHNTTLTEESQNHVTTRLESFYQCKIQVLHFYRKMGHWMLSNSEYSSSLIHCNARRMAKHTKRFNGFI